MTLLHARGNYCMLAQFLHQVNHEGGHHWSWSSRAVLYPLFQSVSAEVPDPGVREDGGSGGNLAVHG